MDLLVTFKQFAMRGVNKALTRRFNVFHDSPLKEKRERALNRVVRLARIRPSVAEMALEKLQAKYDSAPPGSRCDMGFAMASITAKFPQFTDDVYSFMQNRLDHDDTSISRSAIRSLGRLGEHHRDIAPQIMSALFKAVETRHNRGLYAVNAIGRILESYPQISPAALLMAEGLTQDGSDAQKRGAIAVMDKIVAKGRPDAETINEICRIIHPLLEYEDKDCPDNMLEKNRHTVSNTAWRLIKYMRENKGVAVQLEAAPDKAASATPAAG